MKDVQGTITSAARTKKMLPLVKDHPHDPRLDSRGTERLEEGCEG